MARRKITDSADIASAGLPDITPQQQEFAWLYGSGQEKTATAAYRRAYSAENMSDKSIWVEASRLKNDPDVSRWIEFSRQAIFDGEVCTLTQHMRDLGRLRDVAERSGNLGAAVQAEQLRGKASGHYVEQIKDVTAHDPINTLKEIAITSPELAADLAAQHGIPWGAEQGATKH